MAAPISKQTISSSVLQTYLGKAHTFVNQEDQECIEIGPGEAPNISRYKVGGDQRFLRLCICPLNVNMNDKLPISWGIMRQQLDLLNLDETYMFDENMQAPPSWFEVPLSGDLKGYVIKTDKWGADLTNFSLSVAFSPSTGMTCAFLHILLKSDLKQIQDRLQALKSIAWHPLLLPLILLEQRTELAPPDLAKVRTALYKIEKTNGTHKNYQKRARHHQAGYYAWGEEVWNRQEFDSAPGDLTSMASSCALFGAKCKINERFLDWIEEMNQAFSMVITNSSTGNYSTSSSIISGKISTTRTWLKNNQDWSAYLGRRAEVQVQACLSFMAQRDNAFNLKTSKTALRDSSDMRIIANVTLAFLPATAAATFFSTSFFNFQTEGRIVSGWIWLYCVVCVGLTAIAFVAWYWSTRGKALRKSMFEGFKRDGLPL
ncbi:uncharacterized protein BP5553_01620 [Venustampulla echinocandica]|uniref:Uncharacterized protein n=1 Tax=Venustampulla echinocandica TaxID=2656787 RepID=A0A370U1I8_9HELO|nr:uncharacterized protein BP5553_01620 [Venustampulla echinocandica]RDL41641.1 hypothetical protein BP5553_01620 [Venustampulla echinocandica]